MRGSMAARVNAFFGDLATRGTRVCLVYGGNDPGLLELRNYFGPEGRDLRRFGNVSVALIPGADHNLTSARASAAMLEHVVALCTEPAPRDEPLAARPIRAAGLPDVRTCQDITGPRSPRPC